MTRTAKLIVMEDPGTRRVIGLVLFDRFELLDVAGPLELFGNLPDRFRLCLIGPQVGPVPSDQGPALVAGYNYAQPPATDIVLVPGGIGTRPLAKNRPFLDWLRAWAAAAPLVTSVCTGSALLAAAGLLDGYRATSNKRAFAWAKAQGPKVEWVQSARWVQDRDRWTSSGVAAGMDMTLALIAHLHSDRLALDVAEAVEYQWHRESERDPFAASYGLDQR